MDAKTLRRLERLEELTTQLARGTSPLPARLTSTGGLVDYRLIFGTVAQTFTSDDHEIVIDNVKRLTENGADPLVNKTSSTEKLVVYNRTKQNGSPGDEMFAVYRRHVAKYDLWETSTDYEEGDLVKTTNSNVTSVYLCNNDHTSGTFATDIANWDLIRPDENIDWIPLAVGTNGVGFGGGKIAKTRPSAPIPAGVPTQWQAFSSADKDDLTKPCYQGHDILAPGSETVWLYEVAYVGLQAVLVPVCGDTSPLFYRGRVDPNGGTILYPTASGSETIINNGSPIEQDDYYMIESLGTIGTHVVTNDFQILVALTDTPGQTATNWDLITANPTTERWYNMSPQAVAADTFVQGKVFGGLTFVDVENC